VLIRSTHWLPWCGETCNLDELSKTIFNSSMTQSPSSKSYGALLVFNSFPHVLQSSLQDVTLFALRCLGKPMSRCTAHEQPRSSPWCTLSLFGSILNARKLVRQKQWGPPIQGAQLWGPSRHGPIQPAVSLEPAAPDRSRISVAQHSLSPILCLELSLFLSSSIPSTARRVPTVLLTKIR
jgi:hypothetical protein